MGGGGRGDCYTSNSRRESRVFFFSGVHFVFVGLCAVCVFFFFSRRMGLLSMMLSPPSSVVSS